MALNIAMAGAFRLICHGTSVVVVEGDEFEVFFGGRQRTFINGSDIPNT